MTTKRLTQVSVEKMTPPKEGRIEIWDAVLSNFGLRVSHAGTKSWIVMYRKDGKKHRQTLGRYPAISLKDARDLARDLMLKVAKGENITQGRSGNIEYFGDFATRYIEEYAKPNKKSWNQDEAQLNRHILPAWRNKKVKGTTKSDVIILLNKFIAKKQFTTARNLKALLSKMFNWAVSLDIIDASPVANVQLNIPVKEKDRVLQDEELVKLWSSWEAMGGYWAPYFKLLLLTGQRRSEVASIQWEEIADDIWTMPSNKAKNKRVQLVPLTAQITSIITSVGVTESAYLFPARGNPERHMTGFTKAMEKSRLLSGITDWTIHDLRRTLATGLARSKTPPHIISSILNHSPKSGMGITAIYNRWQYLDERKEALEVWGDYVEQLIDNAKSC